MRQPPAHVSRGRQVVAWAAALLLGAVASLALGSAAVAHDVLVGTDPADGAVLDEAPAQVVITFAAEQAGVGAEVVVTGPDAATWSEGPAVVAGTTVTQALADGLPDGAYTVAWRSVAQDGHPVTGAFTFTLDTPDADPAPAEPSPSATSAGDATAPTGAASDDGTGAVTGQAGEPGGWTAWHTAAATLAALLALGGVVLARRWRRG